MAHIDTTIEERQVILADRYNELQSSIVIPALDENVVRELIEAQEKLAKLP